jgi:hypothetical protein
MIAEMRKFGVSFENAERIGPACEEWCPVASDPRSVKTKGGVPLTMWHFWEARWWYLANFFMWLWERAQKWEVRARERHLRIREKRLRH